MRLALLVVVLLLAGLASVGAPLASAAVDDRHGASVPILAASFGSSRIDVLVGDTVTWRNDSVRTHSVAATDGAWSSERLTPNASFSHRFSAPGAVTYYCQLHPFMRSEVDVQPLLLATPREPAAPGRPFVLTGRAALPAGGTVSIEADGKTTSTTTVDADGTFHATVAPTTTTSYRAVAGDQTSRQIQVLVLDRDVVATAHRNGRHVAVTAQVRPASPGATVVLQLHLRERFGWWPVQRLRLGRDSRAHFRLLVKHAVRARVVLTASDAATPLAQSTTLRLRPHR